MRKIWKGLINESEVVHLLFFKYTYFFCFDLHLESLLVIACLYRSTKLECYLSSNLEGMLDQQVERSAVFFFENMWMALLME